MLVFFVFFSRICRYYFFHSSYLCFLTISFEYTTLFNTIKRYNLKFLHFSQIIELYKLKKNKPKKLAFLSKSAIFQKYYYLLRIKLTSSPVKSSRESPFTTTIFTLKNNKFCFKTKKKLKKYR